VPFLDRFEAAAAQGFKAVEFMSPYEYPAENLRALLDKHALALVLFNAAQGNWAGSDRGIAAIPGREREFEASIETALQYARVLGTGLIHVMAGLVPNGAERTTFVANLQRAADRAATEGVTLVVEPINTRDMPGYFVSRTRQALDILGDVARSNVGLQFDLYHRHIMDGDVLAGLEEAKPFIRHMQIASPPDRGEPDAGELDFRALLTAIDASGYTGHIGLEYKPRGETVAGLKWIETLGQNPV
jgi:2-dehydrotetronate isomerase